MARLVMEKLPERDLRRPKFERYVPLVREFLDSGEESARVELEKSDPDAPGVLPTRLRGAISRIGADGDVAVRVRRGAAYLSRTHREEG